MAPGTTGSRRPLLPPFFGGNPPPPDTGGTGRLTSPPYCGTAAAPEVIWDRPHHPQVRLSVRRLALGDRPPSDTGERVPDLAAVLWDGMAPAVIRDRPYHLKVLLHGEADLHGLLARHVASHAWSFIAASAREAPSAELNATTQILANHLAIRNGVLRVVPRGSSLPGRLSSREREGSRDRARPGAGRAWAHHGILLPRRGGPAAAQASRVRGTPGPADPTVGI